VLNGRPPSATQLDSPFVGYVGGSRCDRVAALPQLSTAQQTIFAATASTDDLE
jgi:hypothetical protein